MINNTAMEVPMTITDTIWEPHTVPVSYYKPSTIASQPHHVPYQNTYLHNLVHSVHTHLPCHQHVHRTQEVCPETDVQETASAYHIEMALAGVSDKDSVTIQWRKPRTLIVQGGSTHPEAQTNQEEADFMRPPPGEKLGGLLKKVSASGQPGNADRAEMRKMQDGVLANGDVKVNVPENGVNGHAGKVDFEGADHSGRLFILKERRVGLFQRTFTLPVDVNVEGCRARLEHGLLRIDIPKMEPQARLEERLTLDDT